MEMIDRYGEVVRGVEESRVGVVSFEQLARRDRVPLQMQVSAFH